MGPYEDQKARIQDQVFPLFKNKDTLVAKTPPKKSFGRKALGVILGGSLIDRLIYKKELKKGIIPEEAKQNPK